MNLQTCTTTSYGNARLRGPRAMPGRARTLLRSVWVALLAGSVISTQAHAAVELSYVHVDEIDGKASQGLFASWLEPIAYFESGTVHREFFVGGIRGRSGFPGRDDEDIYFAGAGVRKYWGPFYLGAGLALQDHTNSILSTGYEIVSGFGFTFKHFAIGARHVSNANTGGNNDGENLLTIGYRW